MITINLYIKKKLISNIFKLNRFYNRIFYLNKLQKYNNHIWEYYVNK